jgi:hypothetical protein
MARSGPAGESLVAAGIFGLQDNYLALTAGGLQDRVSGDALALTGSDSPFSAEAKGDKAVLAVLVC